MPFFKSLAISINAYELLKVEQFIAINILLSFFLVANCRSSSVQRNQLQQPQTRTVLLSIDLSRASKLSKPRIMIRSFIVLCLAFEVLLRTANFSAVLIGALRSIRLRCGAQVS